jgi:hypothetical protein
MFRTVMVSDLEPVGTASVRAWEILGTEKSKDGEQTACHTVEGLKIKCSVTLIVVLIVT